METHDPFEPASHDRLGDALRKTLIGSLDYLHARLALLRLEAREAGGDLLLRLIGFIVAGAFCGLAYITALAGTIGWIATAGDWPWYKVTLAIAGFHLLVAVGLVLYAKRRFGQPPFRDSLAEFQRDRQWLGEIRKDT
ncbi:MAG: phage holin family protein [Verrucomicrobiales bacterium]|nr:phage holin family protein [Verrucomicrobiales bacterium]HQW28822.1 phage holin family protein [Verrucomicrobiales bacterium]HQZ29678.1 phage holin family protein [Verrucomicrobiales bacterium]